MVDASASVATLKANVQGYNCNYNVEYALIHGHATLLSSLSSRGAKSKFGLARDAVGVDELEVNVVLFLMITTAGFFSDVLAAKECARKARANRWYIADIYPEGIVKTNENIIIYQRLREPLENSLILS